MCFQAARFDARVDQNGSIVLLSNQDRSRWNQALIQRGHVCLNYSAEGTELSAYHLETGIAMLHCTASSYETTD